MDRLPTRIDKSSKDYSSRESHNSALIEELRQRVDTARNGGGAKYVERHEARGKGMPRDRISEICDPGSPFIELSTLAAFEMYDCLLYTSPSPRDTPQSRMPSSA